MRTVRALRASAAAALLAAVGCDFWSNLIDEKQVTRARLEIEVVDAWTGESLGECECRDSLRDMPLAQVHQGVFRAEDAPTGKYAVRCAHEYYFPGAADFDLPASGGKHMIKLARQGLDAWYPEPWGRVAIPLGKGDSVRYPIDLDWLASPVDDSLKFRYEWKFLRNSQLDHGLHAPLPRDAFLPYYRGKVAGDDGFQEGMDTVILNVYSLLRGPKSPYLVGSDTVPFKWVRNRKPYIKITNNPVSIRLNCPDPFPFKTLRVSAGDSDGTCKSIHVWAADAPSVTQYDTLTKGRVVTGQFDTTLSCGEGGSPAENLPVKLWFGKPAFSGRPNPEYEGSEIYDQTIVAEITDDNGEKARATAGFWTYTNAPPEVTITIPNDKGLYFTNDVIPFVLTAHDTDGSIVDMTFFWNGKDPSTSSTLYYRPDKFPPEHTSDFPGAMKFPVADTYSIGGTALDNCADGENANPKTIRVAEEFAPVLDIVELHADRVLDSLRVSILLSVRDANQSQGDRVDSVVFNWNRSASETYVNPGGERDIYRIQRSHAFPLSELGAEISVQISAFDQHRGVADTTLHIPVP